MLPEASKISIVFSSANVALAKHNAVANVSLLSILIIMISISMCMPH
jgi:hypothetical protein